MVPFVGAVSSFDHYATHCTNLYIKIISVAWYWPVEWFSLGLYRRYTFCPSCAPFSPLFLHQMFRACSRTVLSQYTGLISNPVIEPRASKASVTAHLSTSSETTTVVESISVGGDSGYLSHTHSRSDSLATVSTIAWFNTQEVEQDLEDDIGLIMKPASRKDLVKRFDELEEGEEHDEEEQEVSEDGQSLSVVSHVARKPVRVLKSSLRG